MDHGTCTFRTSTGSFYELTVADTGTTLRRHPDAAARAEDFRPDEVAALRRDHDAVAVLEIVSLEMGNPAVFVLDLRQDGVATIRSTSPVLAIWGGRDSYV